MAAQNVATPCVESALRACLDALVRMDPTAIAVHGLQQCTDAEYLTTLRTAAQALHGTDPSTWPAPVVTILSTDQEQAP